MCIRDRFKVIEHPALVDIALCGSIETEHQEEALIGIRGDP